MSARITIRRGLASLLAMGCALCALTAAAQTPVGDPPTPAVPTAEAAAPAGATTSEADAGPAGGEAGESTAAAPATSAGDEPAADETPDVSMRKLLGVPVLRDEAALAEFLAQSVKSEVQPGVSRDLAVRTIKYLRREDVILSALRKNLALRSSEENIGVFDQALLEAEAVFDPVFDLSFSYKRLDTHQRNEVGTVIKRTFTPQTPLTIQTNPFNPAPQINEIGFLQQQGGEEHREIEASKARPGGPDEPMEYAVGVTQQLPWGPQVNLFTSLVDRRVYRTSRGESFKADWTASAVLDMTVPLPYTRNFGPLAPANFDVKQSELSDERTDWSLRVALNDIMSAADISYWELVRSLENLRIATENRKLVQQQVDRVTKLFNAQMTTEYSKAVIETELTRALVVEEAAKNQVFAAANALAPIIEDSGEAVRTNLYIPADYLDGLAAKAEVDFSSAIQKGLDNRPELKEAHVDLRTRDLERRFAEVQTRPDLQANGTISGSQKSDPYGYYEAGPALLKVVDPDVSDFAGSMSYVRPWGNRALEAAHRQAELSETDQELVIRNLEYDLTREVNDALDNLSGARIRLGFAEQNVNLAEQAYQRILSRREIGADVAALEIVTAIQDLLVARGDRVSALVDNKVAETRLLTAQGTIASEFTSTDTNSPFENRRLDALRQSGALRYFAPAATSSAAPATTPPDAAPAAGQP